MHARRTALIFATQGVGAASGLVALFFIGRFMSPTAYGTFGFAMGFLGLWMVLADMGLERSHVRFIAYGHPLGDCVSTFRTIKLGTVVLFATGASISIAVWAHYRRFTDASGLPVLLAVMAYSLFFILRTIPAGTLNAIKLTASSQVMVLFEHLVKAPLVVLAALFYGSTRDETVPLQGLAEWLATEVLGRRMLPAEGGLLVAFAWATGMLVSLLVGVVLLGRQSLPKGRFDPVLARSYVLFALPVALGASTRIVFANIDAVFIGWFLSAENVGFYFAADRLSALALIIPAALSTVFYPIFGELASRREIDLLNQLAAALQRALSLLMVVVVLFFVVFPAEGIRIFVGDPFLPAQYILPWLGVYALLLSFATITTTIVMALGSPYAIVRAGLAGLVVNIGLNLVFIPDHVFGMPVLGLHSTGAALSTMIAQALIVVLLARETARLTGRAPYGRSILKHLAAATLTGLVLHLLRPVLFGDEVRIWTLALAGVLGLALYAALLVVQRELTRADLDTAWDALHPGRMMAYVREEVRDRRRP